jgi:hypothetical protein
LEGDAKLGWDEMAEGKKIEHNGMERGDFAGSEGRGEWAKAGGEDAERR